MAFAAESVLESIGLIAGNGMFPLLFAREAKSRGYRVCAVAHSGETRLELEPEVDELSWVRVGQLAKTIRALKRSGVRRAVLAGGIDKAGSLWRLRPDWRALRVLNQARARGDDAILRSIAAEFERDGIAIVSSTIFLENILVVPGILAGSAPDAAACEDLRLGARVLCALGDLDIGQGVVVERGVVLAVEAVEGTDAAIERAGKLGQGRAVVVKAAKRGQDMRFDVPAIGPSTIETMVACGAKVLAVEAGSTIVLESDKLAALSVAHGISVVGFSGEGEIPGV